MANASIGKQSTTLTVERQTAGLIAFILEGLWSTRRCQAAVLTADSIF